MEIVRGTNLETDAWHHDQNGDVHSFSIQSCKIFSLAFFEKKQMAWEKHLSFHLFLFLGSWELTIRSLTMRNEKLQSKMSAVYRQELMRCLSICWYPCCFWKQHLLLFPVTSLVLTAPVITAGGFIIWHLGSRRVMVHYRSMPRLPSPLSMWHSKATSLFHAFLLQEKQGPLQHFCPSPKTWNHVAQGPK